MRSVRVSMLPIFTAITLAAAQPAEAPITEAEVKAVVEATDRAVAARDPDAAISAVDMHADIRVVTDTPNGEISYGLTRDELRDYVAASIDLLPDLPKRSSLKIRIAPDGMSAVSTEEVVVSLDFGPIAIHTRETSKATYRRVGGTLKVVKLENIADVQLDGLRTERRKPPAAKR